MGEGEMRSSKVAAEEIREKLHITSWKFQNIKKFQNLVSNVVKDLQAMKWLIN